MLKLFGVTLLIGESDGSYVNRSLMMPTLKELGGLKSFLTLNLYLLIPTLNPEIWNMKWVKTCTHLKMDSWGGKAKVLISLKSEDQGSQVETLRYKWILGRQVLVHCFNWTMIRLKMISMCLLRINIFIWESNQMSWSR